MGECPGLPLGCDSVVGEAMLREKHALEERPDSVSQQIPQPQGQALGLRWSFLWSVFRAWRQSSLRQAAGNSPAYTLVTQNTERGPEVGPRHVLANEEQDGTPFPETLIRHS